MNVHESAKLRHMLCVAGLEIATSQSTADIIIFQTCSIRDTAQRKALTHISQAIKLKSSPFNKGGARRAGVFSPQICVIGCINKPIGGVDIQLGTNQLEILVEKLTGTRPDTRFGMDNSIIITHGCENFCSYCIVPYVRGKEIHRPIEDIEFEFKEIVERGTPRVIYLLGQNVNSYPNFVGLLDRLCKIDGDFTLNFLSSHPKDFDRTLVECIARNPKIERNIHLPMQSGCDKILAAMNRRYTVAQFREKVDLLRARVPGVHITTDIICGFPGETEQDFQQTVAVVKQIKFDAAFIFAYSPREGTLAAKMDGQLDTHEKKRRATKLIEIQRSLSSSGKS